MFQSINLNSTLSHLNRLKFQEQTQKIKEKSLKIPIIFYEICSFLDDVTIFECKYVCSSSRKLIQENDNLENKSLKVELKRVKLLVWGDREIEDKKKNKFNQKTLIEYEKFGKMQLRKEIKKKAEVKIHLEKNEKKIQSLLKEYELTERLYQQQMRFYKENVQAFHKTNDIGLYHPFTLKDINSFNLNDLLQKNVYRDLYQYKDLNTNKLYKIIHNIEDEELTLVEKTSIFINDNINYLIEKTNCRPFQKLNRFIMNSLLNN